MINEFLVFLFMDALQANVRSYYQQFEEQQTQSLIDQRIKEHLGQAAAFQQVGAAFNQHLLGQRPRLPVLPTPVIPGAAPGLMPGIRPPVLPRPIPGAPGNIHRFDIVGDLTISFNAYPFDFVDVISQFAF